MNAEQKDKLNEAFGYLTAAMLSTGDDHITWTVIKRARELIKEVNE